MRDTTPIPIFGIPECIATPKKWGISLPSNELELLPSPDKSKLSLRSMFSSLNRVADEGQSDTYFTAENFTSAKRHIRFFQRFKNFAHFKNYLHDYIISKSCNEECRDEMAFRSNNEQNKNICLTLPEPKLPPLPHTAGRSRSKQKGSRPDISKFSCDYPKWFDNYEKRSRSRNKNPPRYITSIEEEIVLRWPSQLDGITYDEVVISDTSRPSLHTYFDGKNFIVDFYGCYVKSIYDRQCIAPWPSYILILRNGDHKNRQEADTRGRLTVSIEARIGDHIEVFGIDPHSKRFSLDKKVFRISADGTIELVRTIPLLSDGSEPKEPSAAERVARGIGAVAPQIGSLLMFFANPQQAYKNYLQNLEEHNRMRRRSNGSP